MHQDDKEHQKYRATSLSKLLDEIPSEMREVPLLSQSRLEGLVDAQARTAQIEHNMLLNFDAPISNIPSEVLAMIFEAGVASDFKPRPDFETAVSHVSHRWRGIALATPMLWTNIRYIRRPERCENMSSPCPLGQVERNALHLFRSRIAPVRIGFKGFRAADWTPALLHTIGEHIGHCRQLFVEGGSCASLNRLFDFLSHQPAPVLRSIACMGARQFFHFTGPLFSSGSPHLEIVWLDNIRTSTLPFCLPSFESIIHLQLSNLFVDKEDYNCFRSFLMALPSLVHLHLQPLHFESPHSALPITLPNLQFLAVNFSPNPWDLTKAFQTPSLQSLSLKGWIDDAGVFIDVNEPAIHHFLLLRDLTLVNISTSAEYFDALPRLFPNIERLTCRVGSTCHGDIDNMLTAIRCGAPDGGLRWPKLHTVAVSGSRKNWDFVALSHTVLELQNDGHPICKLLLPPLRVAEINMDALAELSKVVELDNFNDNWPKPFERWV